MRREPTDKRTIAFVDGQNLFFAAKEAFGCVHPNYEAQALALKVCERRGWRLSQTRIDPNDYRPKTRPPSGR